MRVISGKARGASLISPKGTSTRPTADRIKESLFNMISAGCAGANFLDLFAGSGAIGIEALSRGARKCVFVENDKRAFRVLAANLEHTKLAHLAETYLTDAEAAVKLLAKKREQFNIVFMDPPYGEAAEMGRLTGLIGAAGLLAADGVIIGEHGAGLDITSFKYITLIKQKNYGKTTAVSFWRPALTEKANDESDFSREL